MAMFMAYQLNIIANQRARRRERVFRDRLHPLDRWNDQEMLAKYRFTRLGCINIINLLHGDLLHQTRRKPHGISISTAGRAVQRVTRALCQHQNRFIKFPHDAEKVRQWQHEFMTISGFPRVVGCIDGTHIQMFNVNKGADEYVYINRKGKDFK